jgi:RNA polymerase sigma-70 factor (ECF subfamily)
VNVPITFQEETHALDSRYRLPLRAGLPVRTRLRLPDTKLNCILNIQSIRGQVCTPAPLSLMKKPIPSSLLDLRRQFLSFLERRIDDRALAEDILQTAYVRALESSGRLREQESAVAWFYRILRNAIIDHYRRRTSERSALDRWAQELELEPVADPLLTDTACQCIERALDTLSPGYASLLRAVDLEEISLAAYAAAHNITPGNAAVRAHRARAALRNQLIRCCGTCATHGCMECTCDSSTRAALQAAAFEAAARR